jgi:glycosyltransferase involved in cell wall biosynthesis
VWDNYPYPMFNKSYYQSNDYIATISRLTDDIVRNVAPDVDCTYIPHAVDSKVFKTIPLDDKKSLREQNLDPKDVDKFIVFWNNRNARRKQSGTLVWWWSEWVKERGLESKVQLVMHTNPKDVHGQDLSHIAKHLGLTNREILFSTQKIPLSAMSTFYNIADVTVNISDAEGFGLSTLESLACGTPIIATVTGGLQEQIIGEGGPFGIPLFPVSKSIIGSQEVPYIYEDRISKNHFFSALSNMYDMGAEERHRLGELGRQHVLKNYNFENFEKQWVEFMMRVHKESGSWETRKNYSNITFKEVA